MASGERQRIGYVLKMYPRLAETFILNEILAHEAAGLDLEIFSLRSPVDGRFHQDLGRVQAEATYVPGQSVKAEHFWETLCEAANELPGAKSILDKGRPESAGNIHQAILLAGAARERGITHLHAHFATLATTVTRLASLLTGIPYTFTAHAKDIYHESVDEQDFRRKLRGASGVVTVSNYNLNFLREQYGDDASGVLRVYNGLDLKEFSYAPPDNRRPLILGVGRLVEKKGFADLIEACAILGRRGRKFRCEIIGEGVLKPELAERISDLGVADFVQMLGARPRGEVNERMREAAVLAAPCVVSSNGNRDGLPTVLVEAMALGTPCVSTTVTGIPEVVRKGDTGLIAAQHDPPSLADALEQLLDDRSLGCRLAANARRLVEAEFDLHRNTAAIREIFGTTRPKESRVAMEVG
ncbi:MAG: glycosyltransferase family 4 protein [Planctomycetota bacterium]|jgi:glycosyltransferase involved in cell wall biosynthesis